VNIFIAKVPTLNVRKRIVMTWLFNIDGTLSSKQPSGLDEQYHFSNNCPYITYKSITIIGAV